MISLEKSRRLEKLKNRFEFFNKETLLKLYINLDIYYSEEEFNSFKKHQLINFLIFKAMSDGNFFIILDQLLTEEYINFIERK